MTGDREDRQADPTPPSLADLEARLAAATGGSETKRKSNAPTDRSTVSAGLGFAFRIASEMVAALVVAIGLGWLVDEWLGSRPIGLVVFLLLGAAAGALNIYRVVNGMGYAVGYRGAPGSDAEAQGRQPRPEPTDKGGE